MAKSVIGSDTLPKAGRVNEVCKEWLVLEDGAMAYRLQNEEINDHYTGNKVRNAQVREDAPKARFEQELEKLKYLTEVQEQEERDALIARQIALSLEKEERRKERELREQMRLQLRLDDEAAQIEIEKEYQRRVQEEKDQELARKLQAEEEQVIDSPDGPPLNDQVLLDHKLALEAQDAEFARMLQEKERLRVKRAKERARQKKIERHQQQIQQQNIIEEEVHSANSSLERSHKPNKSDIKSQKPRHPTHVRQHSDPEEIKPCDQSIEEIIEVPRNVATVIDPTYNENTFKTSSSGTSGLVNATYSSSDLLPEDAPYYMPIPGQRRNTQPQSPTQSQEEKQKRRVKDGCKQQ